MKRESDQVASHIPRLRRYARALMGDVVSADDLVQDTLERALSKFSLWRRNSDLRAWLFTIMHNIYINQGRAASRRAHIMVDVQEVDARVVQASQEDRLVLRDMDRALSQLPEEFREVVLLVGLEQMSYDEVARILGVPKGTVMSRLSRGRDKLRKYMIGNVAATAGGEATLRRVK